MMKRCLAIGLLAAAAVLAWAVSPQKWTFRTYDDFLRGKFDGLSLDADGGLSLAPREEKIAGPTEEFYLSFLAAADGTAYLGTGHGGRIYRFDKAGRSELYFQTQEMDVTCLALDAKGVLFAGTSPHGKIYKITEKDKGVEFFNPSERYIWDLLIEASGTILAAVGESGGVYEISPAGDGRMAFKSDENHILCLRKDRSGAVLAGSGGGGSVYRLVKGQRPQVVLETAFEEVRSMAVTADGAILAAAGGTPRTRKEEPAASAVPAGRDSDVVVVVSAAAPESSAQAAPAPAAKPAASTAAAASPAAKEPGAVYRIAPDGTPEKIWSSAEEMVYTLIWKEADKRLLFGTGPKGRLYALDKDRRLSLVLQKSSEQVFLLVPGQGRIYLAADNPVQLSTVLPEGRDAGEYLSPVLDAKAASRWGGMTWETALPQGTTVQVQTRSGLAAEPGLSWSEWSPPYQKPEGEPNLSPKGRYLQFKISLKSQSGSVSPRISKLAAFYLHVNTAPQISRLDLLPPNEVYLKPIDQDDAVWGLERRTVDPPTGRRDDIKFAVAKKTVRPGFQTAVWEADDENGDALTYAIWIKADDDKEWRLLDDRWTDVLYAFSTAALPDGVYSLKVTASDRPSNPAGQEKSADKTSAAFLIDNGAPSVENLQVQMSGQELTVGFTVKDRFSSVREVKILARPEDWRVVFPEDGVADGRTETFKVKIAIPAGSDRQLSILVRDAVNNTATFKTTF